MEEIHDVVYDAVVHYNTKPSPAVLDIGCKVGLMTGKFRRAGLEAYGIDIDAELFDEEEVRLGHLRQGNIAHLDRIFPGKSFDFIVSTAFMCTAALRLPLWERAARYPGLGIEIFGAINEVLESITRNVYQSIYNQLVPGGYSIHAVWEPDRIIPPPIDGFQALESTPVFLVIQKR
ncbi:MAG TPA: methyltransferase domain-containing protein [Candidatus Nanoarchaeia archaeon]|nr:methyltransferase domain-containing protein [Candidatus Nanoarchaeia archaeon]